MFESHGDDDGGVQECLSLVRYTLHSESLTYGRSEYHSFVSARMHASASCGASMKIEIKTKRNDPH